MDAAYHREYRRRRAAEGRPVGAGRIRDRTGRDRAAEYAKRNAARASRAVEPVPELFPDLISTHGPLIFWDRELERDLRQERYLAELEGRDPVRAALDLRRAAGIAVRFASFDALPEEIREGHSSPILSIRIHTTDGERPASVCHSDRPARVRGLCRACDSWAFAVRERFRAGQLTEEEVRRRVRARVAA